jgi:AraC-like DNA-binding protein
LKELIATAKRISQSNFDLPFSVYTSKKEQIISNVPIAKPLLIFVLSGTKKLGQNNGITCSSGSFVFLSNNPKIDMRNIPSQDDYLAVLVEFEFSDFDTFISTNRSKIKHVEGEITPLLEYSLNQFMNFSSFAPPELIKNRKKEILEILYNSGHDNLANVANAQTLSERVHSMIMSNLQANWLVEELSEQLFMSPSTLRRRLKAEGTSITELRNRARLGLGLHLLQTTVNSIGDIAELCGFQSQSRFSEQFKNLFNMTPRELRKTKMAD